MGEAIGLINLGEIAGRQGDNGASREFFSQGLAIAQSIKHQELEAECERNLGEVALRAGDPRVAVERLARSLKICRDTQDKRGAVLALWRLGKADAASGDYASARAKMAEALPAFYSFGMNSEALDCLEDYADLLQTSGQEEDAVRLNAAAAAAREALALRSPRTDAVRHKNLGAARSALGSAAFEAAWSAGSSWKLEEAVKRALARAALKPVTA